MSGQLSTNPLSALRAGAAMRLGASSAAVEQLERRMLLSATISGLVFNDLNGDKVHQSIDAGLAGWTVYLDNGNGKFDASDRHVLTKADGTYSFTGLTAGTYRVRVDTPSSGGWHRTTPASLPIPVTVTASQSVGGKNFGFEQRGSISGILFE